MELLDQICKALEQVRSQKPLIHHITNYVTVNDCANIVLALGGSPVMADDSEEVEEMVSFASALVLNMGTLNSRTIDSMIKAGSRAKERGIPVVFDPVGVGATTLRTQTAERILREVQPTVLRGNMSEIKVLAGLDVAIRGVDSIADDQGAESIAQTFARQAGSVVAITGKVDIISDGQRLSRVANGHPMLAEITGSGCMTTSLVGTYCSVINDPYLGTLAGVMTMGLAGELAQAALTPGQGTGTFRMNLFDAIYNLSGERLSAGGKIQTANTGA